MPCPVLFVYGVQSCGRLPHWQGKYGLVIFRHVVKLHESSS